MTTQQRLFETESEAASRPARLFAEVVFNRPLDQAFSYAVPPHLEEVLQPGQRVLVPLGRGNRPAVAYCVSLSTTQPGRAVKPILKLIDAGPLLTPALLRLTRWMAEYYLCSWGQVLEAIVPAGARSHAGTRERTFLQLQPDDQQPQPTPRLTPKQARAYAVLEQQLGPIDAQELARLAGCGLTVVMTLVKKGLATRLLQRVEQHQSVPPLHPSEQPLVLNADQVQVRAMLGEALEQGQFKAFLLHGVTGSGKTEIYLQAIDQTVRCGRQALVLVPEISLTPQTIQRFRGRFGEVAVLHSHLGEAERGWHWRQIAAGRTAVIVGARSAVFAPAHRLGLIVVDEEHETSFKQETTPRYHARDVAVMRARMENIPVLLGSATPSLESWHNAQRGQYTLLSLPSRVLDLPLPDVGLIDLRYDTPPRGRYRALSPTLEKAMRAALERGGQVILFLNRRGFSTYICCPACGHVVKCKFCEVTMTHHRQREMAVCHYCGFEQPPPERCSECGLAQVRYSGLGTEKLEAEVAQRFPDMPVQRMDSDNMRRPGAHAKALDAFRRGETKILLGTQMIAKGLDFPNVTLVGVINADLALYLPDFRSAERTFQLLAQVAGRAGRGAQGGRVLVQTMNPEHPCIALATRHDYLSFAEAELKQRQDHGYPPFSRMARVVLRGKDQGALEAFAVQLAESFRQTLPSVQKPGVQLRLLGPAEAPLFRLMNYYRYHFQMLCTSSTSLHKLLRQTLAAVQLPEGIEVAVDIDPASLL